MIFNKRKAASIVILVFSIMAIMGLAAFSIDLGILLNQRYELQKATDTTALIAASEYELYELNDPNDWIKMPDEPKIANPTTGQAGKTYKNFRSTNQFLIGVADATASIDLNEFSKAVKVESKADAVTHFASVLGIRTIRIQAASAAINLPVYLSGIFPKPNGSIINGVGAYRDTWIRDPLDGDTSAGVNPIGQVFNQNNDFKNIYGTPDGRSLSLGPGGFITLRLPAMLYDGAGGDLIIYERGHAEGYFVFAGTDVDPAHPYIDAANPGSGINWVNISCTGIPIYAQIDGILGAHLKTVNINGVPRQDYKFYGSGIFDLGARCTTIASGTPYDGAGVGSTKIKTAKYLKIIDDNIEDGFFLQPRFGINNPSGIPTILPGEHSNYTPGADIDAVGVSHHSRLISVAQYNSGDGDGDGLFDVVEDIYSYNKAAADTDGDGVNDMIEFTGYVPEAALTNASILHAKGNSKLVIMDFPQFTVTPPTMQITP